MKSYILGHDFATPGPEMSLFSRIVPGEKRCIVLKNYFKRSGSKWPGDEEKLFLNELKNKTYIQELLESGELTEEDDTYWMGWSQWQGEGTIYDDPTISLIVVCPPQWNQHISSGLHYIGIAF